jgi:hypothetical protein
VSPTFTIPFHLFLIPVRLFGWLEDIAKLTAILTKNSTLVLWMRVVLEQDPLWAMGIP